MGPEGAFQLPWGFCFYSPHERTVAGMVYVVACAAAPRQVVLRLNERGRPYNPNSIKLMLES